MAIVIFAYFRKIEELNIKVGPNRIFRGLIFGGLVLGRNILFVSRAAYIRGDHNRGGLYSGLQRYIYAILLKNSLLSIMENVSIIVT